MKAGAAEERGRWTRVAKVHQHKKHGHNAIYRTCLILQLLMIHGIVMLMLLTKYERIMNDEWRRMLLAFACFTRALCGYLFAGIFRLVLSTQLILVRFRSVYMGTN